MRFVLSKKMMLIAAGIAIWAHNFVFAQEGRAPHVGESSVGGETAFPYTVTPETSNRKLSAAMRRSFNDYPTPRPEDNELYSQFKYTRLAGLDYHGGDGTVSRRDPTKVIFENGKYYVWYTHRSTPTSPKGPKESTDAIPSTKSRFLPARGRELRVCESVGLLLVPGTNPYPSC